MSSIFNARSRHQGPLCHPEQSEGSASLVAQCQILRFAQDDELRRIKREIPMLLTAFLADASPFDGFASFGVAGLMGAMWLWERRTSQKRELQIDEAHARILGDRVQLEQLMSVIRQNAEAITRLSATQD